MTQNDSKMLYLYTNLLEHSPEFLTTFVRCFILHRYLDFWNSANLCFTLFNFYKWNQEQMLLLGILFLKAEIMKDTKYLNVSR